MSARLPRIDLRDLELIEDVAPRLGVAESTVREWCRRGRLPSVKLPGTRRILIPRDWVERYVAGDVKLDIESGPDGGRVVRPASCSPLGRRGPS